MRYRAGDVVRILHPSYKGEVRAVTCLLDGLIWFTGIDGGLMSNEVELVRNRTRNPCGRRCEEHPPQGSCWHCRGLCQQPYGGCPPRKGEPPAVTFMGPRFL